jgi:hypothetical protein
MKRWAGYFEAGKIGVVFAFRRFIFAEIRGFRVLLKSNPRVLFSAKSQDFCPVFPVILYLKHSK